MDKVQRTLKGNPGLDTCRAPLWNSPRFRKRLRDFKKYPRVRYFQDYHMEFLNFERVLVFMKSIPGLEIYRSHF